MRNCQGFQAETRWAQKLTLLYRQEKRPAYYEFGELSICISISVDKEQIIKSVHLSPSCVIAQGDSLPMYSLL